jgi:hypothetical protein
MDLKRRNFMIAGGISLGAALVVTMRECGANTIPTLTFMNKSYVLRTVESGDTAFVFLLLNQPDSDAGTESFSVISYKDVSSYDQLHAKKDLVAASFKKPGSVIFTDKDAPPSADFRGECFLVAGQGAPSSTDINFSRFVLADQTGFCLLYTKSFYDHAGESKDSATIAGAWINSVGSDVSNALIGFSITLNQSILKEWAASVP